MSSYHPENPQPVESRWPEALVRFRWFAVGAATAFAVAVAVGTGAAPSPFEPVSEVLGLSDHGESVSDAVEEAKDTLEDGEPVGPAVSEAACTAAHDRTTLPEGAQNAPGQQDREPKDCTHPSNAEDDDPPEVVEGEEDETDTEDASEDTHGAAVSGAVHDARDAAKEAGEPVGPAVSEAACTAAHDRSTLPEGAQNAPGQQDREPKDCTHPSNRDAGDGEGEPNAGSLEDESPKKKGGGKSSAPGQQKKQGN